MLNPVSDPDQIMFSAIKDRVVIELIIEGNRNEIFEKITRSYSQSPFTRDQYLASSSNSSDDSSFYFIQDSLLSEDRKEIVFEVRMGGDKFYYLAFEFKGFVCCPAFLAKSLRLGGYACLSVRKDREFSYILRKLQSFTKIAPPSMRRLKFIMRKGIPIVMMIAPLQLCPHSMKKPNINVKNIF